MFFTCIRVVTAPVNSEQQQANYVFHPILVVLLSFAFTAKHTMALTLTLATFHTATTKAHLPADFGTKSLLPLLMLAS